ncbi:recombinase family protein [Ectobacillus panaciterrae]|uniref:recombinase family protein n=1 Tax=Ectobacillus panaciterrae TaxID=363872 RepID=UPI0024814107|nr:recombinase family protein [Ectobacillus panaciterrae]
MTNCCWYYPNQFVVYKLDRLARSTKKLIEITEYLEQHNIEFSSVFDKIDTTTPAGKAMFKMFAAFAEFECDIIRERVLNGLEAARARGRKGGRPRKSEKVRKQVLTMYESKSAR